MFPDQATFIEKALEALGLTQTGLGDLLGYRNAYQAGHRIANGQKPLRYGETMLLLEACGWIGDITEGHSPLAEPGELIGVALARLLAGQEAQVKELREIRTSLDGIRSQNGAAPTQQQRRQ